MRRLYTAPGVAPCAILNPGAQSSGYYMKLRRNTRKAISCCTVTAARLHEPDILHGKTCLVSGSNLPLHRLSCHSYDSL